MHRVADAFLGLSLILAVGAALVGLLVLGRGSHLDRRLAAWTTVLPRPFTLLLVCASGLGVALFSAVGLFSRNRKDGLSALSGASASLATGVMAYAILVSPPSAVLGSRPAPFLINTMVVAFVTASEVCRRGRWRGWCVAFVGALLFSGLLDRSLGPVSVLLAGATGGGGGYLVRWGVGASSTRPGEGEIREWLDRHGIRVARLEAPCSSRAGTFDGALPDGTSIEVRLADRDSWLADATRRGWSWLRLRFPMTGSQPVLSPSRLRDLALSCCLAQQGNVIAPRLLMVEPINDETLALASTRPSGRVPQDALTAEEATSAFRTLRGLHSCGVAHGHMRIGELVFTYAGCGVLSLSRAMPAASALSRRLDVAQLLVAIGQTAGPDTAVSSLRQGYGPVDEVAMAAVLQPVALASWGWAGMKRSSGCLTDLRSLLLPPGAEVPPVQLERFRWRTVLSVGALVLVAYILVGQISSVDLASALGRMNLYWFGAATFGSAVTYWAAAANIDAFLPERLPLTQGFLVQVATAFAGVAMPSTVGYVAMNARYLNRRKVDPPSITAALTLAQLANVAVTVLTVVVLGLLTGSGISQSRIAPSADLMVGGLIVVGAGGVLMAIPQARVRLARLLMPHIRSLVPRFVDTVSHPLGLVAGIGSTLLLNAAYVGVLLAALESLGARPPIIPTALVFLVGNSIGSAVPTPGGLGGVEAALAAGLTGIGIPAHAAIPAVIVFRLATFWLPIPIGAVTYAALRRSGTL